MYVARHACHSQHFSLFFIQSSIAPLPSSPSVAYTNVTHPVPELHQSERSREVLELGERYILPVYARPPIVLDHGKGSWVWDCDGRKYLDFSAGIAVNALGHSDEGVTEVLRAQSSKLLHASNVYHNEHAPALAALIVTLTQREGGLGYPTGTAEPTSTPGAKVFFSNSGTEANEGALKVARKVGKDRGGERKHEIVCFEQSFHGRSLGALSITVNAKYQSPFAPLLPGVRVGKLNVLEGLEDLITKDTCAVVLEPIQGEGGVNAAGVDWVRRVVTRAREVGAVVIFDEIQCGLYRTSSLWAHSAWPVECHPDIVTMAKPLANGYPIGAVLLRDSVAETMTAGTHGTTFGGSPLACAVGHHVLSRLSAREFVSHLTETSAYLAGRLEQLPRWFPQLVGGVRGRGLIVGLVLKEEGHPSRLVELARERGVLLLSAGKDCVRLVPSLTVTREEVASAVDVIESCLTVLMGGR
ncbi:acetylornithine aminotransferase [Auriscalpium vulgare]|uniref:Acetylornithine aminotransferase n=1 Tax=Auriscalpium vulgare TaxID=40419 RepID=A0ACB8RAU6_9AGAM|nr:acetylornithine aminotransferase [Auriscalpium vulgare]